MKLASLKSPNETPADNRPAHNIHCPVTEDPFLQMKKMHEYKNSYDQVSAAIFRCPVNTFALLQNPDLLGFYIDPGKGTVFGNAVKPETESQTKLFSKIVAISDFSAEGRTLKLSSEDG